jgi:hypothetical protein
MNTSENTELLRAGFMVIAIFVTAWLVLFQVLCQTHFYVNSHTDLSASIVQDYAQVTLFISKFISSFGLEYLKPSLVLLLSILHMKLEQRRLLVKLQTLGCCNSSQK